MNILLGLGRPYTGGTFPKRGWGDFSPDPRRKRAGKKEQEAAEVDEV
jgi:hypothetical protein